MGEVSFERRGSGSPVVLVHGLGSRWQSFAPILDRLAEHHDVIAVDLPGFGDSPADPGVRPGPRGYADWLAGWLVEQDIERPHVVGSSMGGGVALELGRRGVASGVTAFAPVGFYGAPGLRWAQGSLTAIRAAARVGRPAFDRAVDHRAGRVALLGAFFGHPTRVAPDAARTDIAGLTGASSFTQARNDFGDFRLKPGHDLGALPGIPATVAWGTRDFILIHRTQSARARAVLPLARHVDLPGCGHLPFNDDPVTCAGLVLEGAALAEEK